MDFQAMLREISLFASLPPEQIQVIQQCVSITKKSQGETILVENQESPGIFIVVKGEVGVYRKKGTTAIAKLHENDVFGEMSFIDNSPVSATIRALSSPSLIAVVNKKDIEKQLIHRPETLAGFYRGLAISLSDKLRQTSKHISDLRYLVNHSDVMNDIELLSLKKQQSCSTPKIQFAVERRKQMHRLINLVADHLGNEKSKTSLEELSCQMQHTFDIVESLETIINDAFNTLDKLKHTSNF